MSKKLLVIARDYWGTVKAVETATKFSIFMKQNIGVSDVKEITGDFVTRTQIMMAIEEFVESVNCEPDSVGYIYMAGHGNQINDNGDSEDDGCDEVYSLPDGNITDYWLICVLKKYTNHSSIIVLISDHCCSGSMLDTKENSAKWISIGSSLDHEDSYASGDGNVMTITLLDYLKSLNIEELKSLTPRILKEKLHEGMQTSFIGDLQHVSVHASGYDCWDFSLFR